MYNDLIHSRSGKWPNAAQHTLQPTSTRAAFNCVGLLSIVLGRLARLAFNERVDAAELCR